MAAKRSRTSPVDAAAATAANGVNRPSSRHSPDGRQAHLIAAIDPPRRLARPRQAVPPQLVHGGDRLRLHSQFVQRLVDEGQQLTRDAVELPRGPPSSRSRLNGAVTRERSSAVRARISR